MIELKDVTKTYRMGGEDIHALEDVSLSIQPGDFVAIMGPSGSGKSTLANIISGLESPTAGSVHAYGQDISELGDKDLSRYRNRTIGFVFQNFNLQPHYTAVENVAMPLVFAGVASQERLQEATEVLTKLGLGDRLRHRPSELSGGQRQRVAIARALVTSPKVLVADEPTGNLDSVKGREVMAIIKDLHKSGLTIILITHDPVVAQAATRTITIKDGRINL